MSVRKNVSKREEFVSKGSDVSSDRRSKKKQEWKVVNLRIPKEIVDSIDVLIEGQPFVSRTEWIFNAIKFRMDAISLDIGGKNGNN
jgi:hypothetical protein